MALTDAQRRAIDAAMVEDAKEAASAPASSNQPQGNSLGSTLMDRLYNTVDSVFTGVNAGLNTATFGLTGLAERTVGGVVNSVGQDDTSFMEGVDQSTQGIRDREARNPGATLMGEIAGTVAGAGKLQSVAEVAGRGAMTVGQRIRMAAGIGAAENLGARAGHGDISSISDGVQAAGLGGFMGGAGQTVGEIVEPAVRGIAKRLGYGVEDAAQASAKENLTGQNKRAPESASGRMSMPDTGPAGLMREAIDGGTMRQDQILADKLGPRMVTETKTMARNPELVPGLGPLRDLMENRITEVDTSASRLADKYLRPDLTSAGDNAAISKAALSDIRPQYTAMIESPAATAFSIPRGELQNLVRATIPSNTAGPAKDTGAWLQNLLDRSGDVSDATGNADNMSPDVLIEVKKTIDVEIGKLMRGEVTAIDKGSLARLSSFKAEITSMVSDAVPDYAAVAGKYSDELRLQDLTKTGSDMFSSNKVDADTMQGFMDSIGDDGASAAVVATQRQAFIDGGLQAMMLKNGAGSVTELRRLMRPGSNEYDKLSVMIPSENLDSYVSGADTLMGEVATAKTIGRSIESAASNLPSAGVDPAVYAAGGVMSAVAQRFGPAAYMLGRVLGDPTPGRVNQILMDLYSAQGPEAAEKALDAIMAAPPAKQASMVGGLIGNNFALNVNLDSDRELPTPSVEIGDVPKDLMSIPQQPFEQAQQGGSIMGN